MESYTLQQIYKESLQVKSLVSSLAKASTFAIKGIAGSVDSLITYAVYESMSNTHLVILHDKEEADYFQNDLRNFIKEKDIYLFPGSYKKPYQFEETENANVLQRAEVLNRINSKEGKIVIVTYPDALYEKVINKRSLVENTMKASVGEKLDVDFISDLLIEYGFEKNDFVYEAGQFAVRGGIIDVFSFSDNYPFRLELFGDEIESIRLFDPESQISIQDVNSISIIPNVQDKLISEERQSFFEFLPQDTIVWFKDYRETSDLIEKGFLKAKESFDRIMSISGNTQVILKPTDLFDSEKSFKEYIASYKKIEFGKRFYLNHDEVVQFEVKPQPTFHKKFDLLASDLLEHQSRFYQKFISSESSKQINRLETIFHEIDPTIQFTGLIASLREGFIDHSHEVLCYTDHQIFDRFHKVESKERFTKSKSLTLKELKTLQPGDYVVHVDYGIGRFVGMETVMINDHKQEALRLIYKDDDLLSVSIHSLHKISRYSGKEGAPPAISKLGSPEWDNKKKKVKSKIKDIAKDLIELYAKRKAAPGFAFEPDNYLQAELESSFLYQDTPDQAVATVDVKKDMEQPHPMDRLVCGDVGFGKTEIAIRAAFKAILSGKQVAVLVPTTILAMQHFRTFSERFTDFPVSVDYINRFKTTKEINEIKEKIKNDKIDILIGTHRIVNKDIVFKDLGLMIIDEEQKFGVKVKEKLKELRVNVDALTLTATPIPRTLHFSLLGARDLSIISTPPPNRRGVTTEIHEFNDEIIRDSISHEIRRGGQVFFVHNKVSDIEKIANVVLKLVPDASIGIAHGQMEGKQLEKVMLKFINGEHDVLISTNIIESGLDIPNANTIIINAAHTFGLSDLHQMRGRVGRSNTKAYCYFLTPPVSVLSSDARKRLNTLEEFSELGDGFKVAMRDLDIRGAGNLLGSEQSGFINDIGFEMYHKIIDEAVQELKEDEFKSLFETDALKDEELERIVEDCIIETDLELIIPESYVSNISERLSLYSELDNINDHETLDKFKTSLKDRFGIIPDSVHNLIESVELRWLASKIGFEKLTIKNSVMKCYLSDSKDESYFNSEHFGAVLAFIQQHPRNCNMREYKNKLIISIKEVDEVKKGIETLNFMLLETHNA
ncbi:MAG: transcription-repair coupling factor [Bacteroidota bacterium]